jgi:hypothetical protein
MSCETRLKAELPGRNCHMRNRSLQAFRPLRSVETAHKLADLHYANTSCPGISEISEAGYDGYCRGDLVLVSSGVSIYKTQHVATPIPRIMQVMRVINLKVQCSNLPALTPCSHPFQPSNTKCS